MTACAPNFLAIDFAKKIAHVDLTYQGWFLAAAPARGEAPSTAPTPTVILMHGYGGTRDVMLPYAAFLSNAGFHVFFFDARGVGHSAKVEVTFGEREKQDVLGAMSDTFFFGVPLYLQMSGFEEVKASVFQLTRSPGRNIVYAGCALLVLGVLAMFYVRERRLWLLVKADGAVRLRRLNDTSHLDRA